MSGAVSAISFDEGVVKYVADHRAAALPQVAWERCSTLGGWRRILSELSLVGQCAGRYGGAGFGNMSARLGPYPGDRRRRRFVVTGTQTSGRPALDSSGFAVVEAYEARENRVISCGPVSPSSEALTHGAIYDLDPRIRFVFHVHSPVIWQVSELLRLPTSRPDIPYGTPEMASEVGRLYRDTRLSEQQILCMGGHEDGVIAFGTTAEQAGVALMRVLALAYERRDAGGERLHAAAPAPSRWQGR